MITTIQHQNNNHSDSSGILKRFFLRNSLANDDLDIGDELATIPEEPCWMKEDEDVSCHGTVATAASTATELTRRTSLSSIDDSHLFDVPTPVPTPSSSLVLWVEEEEEDLDEATKALQDRIASLRISLELTQKREAREIERIQKSTERKKAIVAQTIRKEYDTQQVKKQTLMMQKQGKLIRALQAHNTQCKKDCEQITKAITNLLQSNVRLQLATEESRECLAKYTRLLIKPAQSKQQDLLLQLDHLDDEKFELDKQIIRAKDDAAHERKSRRMFGKSIGRLLHKVQHRAWYDHVLLSTLNYGLNSNFTHYMPQAELPPAIIVIKR